MKNHLSIEKSVQFQTEYNDFKKQIDQVHDLTIKQELELVLGKLLNEVRNMDKLHVDLAFNNKLPSGVSDSRTTIKQLRQLIVKKLKDWEQSKKE